jgi:hypothetical protein
VIVPLGNEEKQRMQLEKKWNEHMLRRKLDL